MRQEAIVILPVKRYVSTTVSVDPTTPYLANTPVSVHLATPAYTAKQVRRCHLKTRYVALLSTMFDLNSSVETS